MISVKRNFIYSSILTISNYIFPLLTFPYVTRVLGVENMGIYNFVDSIVQYFTIFSMLGITTIGIREIAKNRNNAKELSKTFSSLLTLNLLTTLFAVFILLIFSFIIPKFQQYQEMIFLAGARILFNALLIEWFYKGIENFRYITLRSIIIRSIYVVSVFVFVRDSNDYVLYFGLTSLALVVNAIINIIYSRKYVHYSLSIISFKPYIKSLLVLGIYQILTSMYTSFNVIYLGLTATDKEVGYYTTAVRLYTIILSLFTAFTGVMLPRMSSLIAEKKYDEFKRMTKLSINVLIVFVMPLIVICEVFSPHIIQIIAGNGYEGAIIPMRIVIPLMLIIGYEQIIIVQILTPMKKDKAIFVNSVWGCGVGLISNIMLVPCLQAIGSSIVWVFSELVVLISAQYFVFRFTGYSFPLKLLLRELCYMIPIMIVDVLILLNIESGVISLLIGVGITYLYYFIIVCLLQKNQFVNTNINELLRKCNVDFQLP